MLLCHGRASNVRAGSVVRGVVLLMTALAVPVGAQAPGKVDPQVLVDVARPGSTVIVPSGTHEGLVVTKPLTLVGSEPRPTLGPILLAGPGAGRLTLTNLATLGRGGTSAPIEGRGFAEVHVSDCDLTGPVRLKGVQFLTIARTTVRQAGTVGPFIEARAASTSLQDVVLEPFSPPMTNPFADVVTGRLGLANASVPGRVDAKRVQVFANDLALSGSPRPGGWIDLTWSTPAPSVAVYSATGTRHPTFLQDGIWFLALDAAIVAVDGSPGGTTFPIPAEPALIGQPIAFQVHDWVPPRALSRVVSTVIH